MSAVVNEEDGQISDPTKEDRVSNTILVAQQETGGNAVKNDHVDPSDEMVDGDTFPRDYVEKLRDENAKYRQRAQDRDEVAAQLHTALVAATGRLQDPTDLPFDNDHIDAPDKMIAAIDELLTAKPHLASRKPSGNIGQGMSVASDTFSLSGALRANAT